MRLGGKYAPPARARLCERRVLAMSWVEVGVEGEEIIVDYGEACTGPRTELGTLATARLPRLQPSHALSL